jgi:arabinose-5-phosphate isomerase
MLNKTENISGLTAQEIMTKNPKTIKSTDMVSDALNIMKDFSITQLVVVDNGEYKGVIHLHDILKEGII